MQIHLQNGSPHRSGISNRERKEKRELHSFIPPLCVPRTLVPVHILCPQLAASYRPLSFLTTCDGSLSLLPLQILRLCLTLLEEMGTQYGGEQAGFLIFILYRSI